MEIGFDPSTAILALNDRDESFDEWKLKNAPEDTGEDYDLAGAFNANLHPAENGHFPDTFKKPNHPTFSNQSIYSTDEQAGGEWGKDNQGRDTFKPSPWMGSDPARHENLKSYFKEREPNATLIDPDPYDKPFDPSTAIPREEFIDKFVKDGTFDPANYKSFGVSKEDAFEIRQKKKDRTLVEKTKAFASGISGSTFAEAAKGVAKFIGGLAAMTGEGIVQTVAPAVSTVLKGLGYNALAKNVDNELLSERRELALGASHGEEAVKSLGRNIGQFSDDISHWASGGPRDNAKEMADFDADIAAADREQQLHEGKFIEGSIVSKIAKAGSDMFGEGKDIESTLGAKHLEEEGARKANELVVEMLSAGMDPVNIALMSTSLFTGGATSLAGKISTSLARAGVAGKVASGVIRGAMATASGIAYIPKLVANTATRTLGAAASFPFKIIRAIPSRLGKITRIGETGLTAGLAVEAAMHPALFVKAAGVAAMARVFDLMGKGLTAAGETTGKFGVTNLDQRILAGSRAGQRNLLLKGSRAFGQGVHKFIEVPIEFAPFNLASSGGDPNKFADMSIGAGMFGAGFTTKAHLRSSFQKSLNAKAHGVLMIDHGAKNLSDVHPDIFAMHQVNLFMFSDQIREEIQKCRSLSNGGLATDVLVLSPEQCDIIRKDKAKYKIDIPKKFDTQCAVHLTEQGKILINTGEFRLVDGEIKNFKGGVRNQAHYHEIGHAVLESIRKGIETAHGQSVIEMLKHSMSPEEQKKAATDYLNALHPKGIPASEIAKLEATSDLHLDESLSEISRSLLRGQDLARYGFSQESNRIITKKLGKILHGIARTMGMGLTQMDFGSFDMKVDISGERGPQYGQIWNQEVAKAINSILHEVGQRADRKMRGVSTDADREFYQKMREKPPVPPKDPEADPKTKVDPDPKPKPEGPDPILKPEPKPEPEPIPKAGHLTQQEIFDAAASDPANPIAAVIDAHKRNEEDNEGGLTVQDHTDAKGIPFRTVDGVLIKGDPFSEYLLDQVQVGDDGRPLTPAERDIITGLKTGGVNGFVYGHAGYEMTPLITVDASRRRRIIENPAEGRIDNPSRRQNEQKRALFVNAVFNERSRTITLQMLSVDKLNNNYQNLVEAIKIANDQGASIDNPYATDADVVVDLKNYAENYKNNWAGDGHQPVRDADGNPLSTIGEPHKIDFDKFNFINLLLANESLKSSTRLALARRRIARANGIALEVDLESNPLRKRLNEIFPKNPETRNSWSEDLFESPHEILRPELIREINGDIDSVGGLRGVGPEFNEAFDRGIPDENMVAGNYMPAEDGVHTKEELKAIAEKKFGVPFIEIVSHDPKRKKTSLVQQEIDNLQSGLLKHETGRKANPSEFIYLYKQKELRAKKWLISYGFTSDELNYETNQKYTSDFLFEKLDKLIPNFEELIADFIISNDQNDDLKNEINNLFFKRSPEYLAKKRAESINSQIEYKIKEIKIRLERLKNSDLIEENKNNQIIENLRENLKEKLKTGTPFFTIAFHASPFGRIDSFNDSKLGTYTNAPSAGKGHFFATNKNVADSYFATHSDFPKEFQTKGFLRLNAEGKKEAREMLDQMIRDHNDDPNKEFELDADDIKSMADDAGNEVSYENIGIGYDNGPIENVSHETYVMLENPLVYDMKGDTYREKSYYDLMVQAEEEGRDGVVILNTYDGGPALEFDNHGEITAIVAVLEGNASKIKSADLITMDEFGNPIPLEKRFDVGTNKISYMPASAEIRERGTKQHLELYDRLIDNPVIWNKFVKDSGMQSKPNTLEALNEFIERYAIDEYSTVSPSLFKPINREKIRDYYKNLTRNATDEQADNMPADQQRMRDWTDEQFDRNFTQNKVDKINTDRATELQESANYLLGEMKAGNYPVEVVATILHYQSAFRVDIEKNEDKILVTKVTSIDGTNERMPNNISGETASIIADYIKDKVPSKEAFVKGISDTIEARIKERGDYTGWKKYDQSKEIADYEKLNADASGTGWCTGGSKSVAQAHLNGGDFYIYFEDGDPKIAIKTTNGNIDEVRGRGRGQNIITPELDAVAENYIKSGDGPSGGNDYIEFKKLKSDIRSIKETGIVPKSLYKYFDIFGMGPDRIDIGIYELSNGLIKILKTIPEIDPFDKDGNILTSLEIDKFDINDYIGWNTNTHITKKRIAELINRLKDNPPKKIAGNFYISSDLEFLIPYLTEVGSIHNDSATILDFKKLETIGDIQIATAREVHFRVAKKIGNIYNRDNRVYGLGTNIISAPKATIVGKIQCNAVTLNFPLVENSTVILCNKATKLVFTSLKKVDSITAPVCKKLNFPSLIEAKTIDSILCQTANFPLLTAIQDAHLDSAKDLNMPLLIKANNLALNYVKILDLPSLIECNSIGAAKAESINIPKVNKADTIFADDCKILNAPLLDAINSSIFTFSIKIQNIKATGLELGRVIYDPSITTIEQLKAKAEGKDSYMPSEEGSGDMVSLERGSEHMGLAKKMLDKLADLIPELSPRQIKKVLVVGFDDLMQSKIDKLPPERQLEMDNFFKENETDLYNAGEMLWFEDQLNQLKDNQIPDPIGMSRMSESQQKEYIQSRLAENFVELMIDIEHRTLPKDREIAKITALDRVKKIIKSEYLDDKFYDQIRRQFSSRYGNDAEEMMNWYFPPSKGNPKNFLIGDAEDAPLAIGDRYMPSEEGSKNMELARKMQDELASKIPEFSPKEIRESIVYEYDDPRARGGYFSDFAQEKLDKLSEERQDAVFWWFNNHLKEYLALDNGVKINNLNFDKDSKIQLTDYDSQKILDKLQPNRGEVPKTDRITSGFVNGNTLSENDLYSIQENYSKWARRSGMTPTDLIQHIGNGNASVWSAYGTNDKFVGQFIGDTFVVSHFAPEGGKSAIGGLMDLLHTQTPVVFAVPDRIAGQLERLGFRRSKLVIPMMFKGEVMQKNLLANNAVTGSDTQKLAAWWVAESSQNGLLEKIGNSDLLDSAKEGINQLQLDSKDASYMPFAGEGATGYAEAEKRGDVFVNPFDLMKRFEISDDKMESLNAWRKLYNDGDQFDFILGDLYDHPELFKNYPWLKDIPVIVEFKNDDTNASVNYDGTQINVEFRYLKKLIDDVNFNNEKHPTQKMQDRADLKLKKTIIHEIQHLIQFEEKFAMGGNSAASSLADTLNFIKYAKQEALRKAVDKFNRSSSKDERAAIALDVSKMRTDLDLWDQHYKNTYGFSYGQFEPTITKMQLWQLYQSIAGEMESRAAADRSGMTSEDRKKFPVIFDTNYKDNPIVTFRLPSSEKYKSIEDANAKRLGVDRYMPADELADQLGVSGTLPDDMVGKGLSTWMHDLIEAFTKAEKDGNNAKAEEIREYLSSGGAGYALVNKGTGVCWASNYGAVKNLAGMLRSRGTPFRDKIDGDEYCYVAPYTMKGDALVSNVEYANQRIIDIRNWAKTQTPEEIKRFEARVQNWAAKNKQFLYSNFNIKDAKFEKIAGETAESGSFEARKKLMQYLSSEAISKEFNLPSGQYRAYKSIDPAYHGLVEDMETTGAMFHTIILKVNLTKLERATAVQDYRNYQNSVKEGGKKSGSADEKLIILDLVDKGIDVNKTKFVQDYRDYQEAVRSKKKKSGSKEEQQIIKNLLLGGVDESVIAKEKGSKAEEYGVDSHPSYDSIINGDVVAYLRNPVAAKTLRPTVFKNFDKYNADLKAKGYDKPVAYAGLETNYPLRGDMDDVKNVLVVSNAKERAAARQHNAKAKISGEELKEIPEIKWKYSEKFAPTPNQILTQELVDQANALQVTSRVGSEEIPKQTFDEYSKKTKSYRDKNEKAYQKFESSDKQFEQIKAALAYVKSKITAGKNMYKDINADIKEYNDAREEGTPEKEYIYPPEYEDLLNEAQTLNRAISLYESTIQRKKVKNREEKKLAKKSEREPILVPETASVSKWAFRALRIAGERDLTRNKEQTQLLIEEERIRLEEKAKKEADEKAKKEAKKAKKEADEKAKKADEKAKKEANKEANKKSKIQENAEARIEAKS